MVPKMFESLKFDCILQPGGVGGVKSAVYYITVLKQTQQSRVCYAEFGKKKNE